MIKPILIQANKQSIEIGDLNLPNHLNKINEGKLGIAVRPFKINDAYKAYDILLIDTKAKIVESSYYFANQGVRKCIRVDNNTSCPYIHLNSKGEELGDFYTWTGNVIAVSKGTTSPDDIDINLPQLSNASKLLLIDYYNEYKCMPESVDVETWFEVNPQDLDVERIKLNQQGEIDITIPEEEKKYTESEVLSIYRDYQSYLIDSEGIPMDLIEWFNSKKK